MSFANPVAAEGGRGRAGPQSGILFLLLPERSAFNASFTLARKLRERGHRIVYAGPEETREYVERQGFDYRVFDTEPVPQVEGTRTPPRFGERWLSERRQIVAERQAHRALLQRGLQAMREERPALVLLDPIAWPLARLPLECGVPMLTFNTSLASALDPSVPSAFGSLLPGDLKRWRGRWRNRLDRRLAQWRHRAGLFAFERLLPLRWALLPQRRSLLGELKALGARIEWCEYGPRPAQPELVACAGAFDFPELANRRQRLYIGSCVDRSRVDTSFDWSGIDDRPLLYCSLGTYSHVYRHSRRLFTAVVEALKQREDWQGVVQIGTAMKAEDFGELPKRIRIIEQAPQLQILERAAVFVTHGGLGSVREAICFAVPMMVFPCWNEQPGNAARVVHHGLGVRSDITRVDTATILQLLAVLERGETQPSLSAMQAAFERSESCNAGIEFIESVLQASLAPIAAPDIDTQEIAA